MRCGGSSSTLYRAVGATIICLVVTGVIGIIAAGLHTLPEGKAAALTSPSNMAFSLSYTTHAPIRIDSNSQFTGANGVVSGNGTASDPYLIEGWSIETSAESDISDIAVENSSAHFIVKDCYIHANDLFGSMSLNNGIFLVNCINGVVDDNICSHNGGAGVSLYKSKNCIVSNNNCTPGHGAGILISSSSNITVSDNICSQNTDGIILLGSSDCTLSNNSCAGNYGWGVTLVGASKNELFRNQLRDNSIDGIFISSGAHNMIWNNSLISNGAEDDGKDNSWSSPNGYGNYWSNWTTPDNVAPFGRVDYPYEIHGSAGAKDNYPLTAPLISDPPYAPGPRSMSILILAIAVIIIAAMVFVSFISSRRHRGKTEKQPPSSK